MRYDLEERTTRFGKKVIQLGKTVPITSTTRAIIEQLMASGTSIGANYREANGASSKKDFRNKIFICKKEARETEYWLELMEVAYSPATDSIKHLRTEAHELSLIFSKIAISSST